MAEHHETLNDNCFGINMIHDFKVLVAFTPESISLYKITQTALEPQQNQLVLKEVTTFPANSVTITML